MQPVAWWVLCAFHNCVVHPVLPLADLLHTLRPNRFSNFIYTLHDRSGDVLYPEGK
jgi:hypothetical protein